MRVQCDLFLYFFHSFSLSFSILLFLFLSLCPRQNLSLCSCHTFSPPLPSSLSLSLSFSCSLLSHLITLEKPRHHADECSFPCPVLPQHDNDLGVCERSSLQGRERNGRQVKGKKNELEERTVRGKKSKRKL